MYHFFYGQQWQESACKLHIFISFPSPNIHPIDRLFLWDVILLLEQVSADLGLLEELEVAICSRISMYELIAANLPRCLLLIMGIGRYVRPSI